MENLGVQFREMYLAYDFLGLWVYNLDFMGERRLLLSPRVFVLTDFLNSIDAAFTVEFCKSIPSMLDQI